ncbi:hypothetical protein TanjilG_10322 [Lupinus angustifolius]|uniref:Uncharacterized protein n=1 Tax=Lupinus angustifolius TaxID=3871 RepID=A0A394DFI7_LUPAN|nr:hypothetical protein TanjilG_10322 [Lupinus angustifolius]
MVTVCGELRWIMVVLIGVEIRILPSFQSAALEVYSRCKGGIEIPNSSFIIFDVGFELMGEDNNVNPLRLLDYAVVSMPLPRIRIGWFTMAPSDGLR